MGTSTLAAGRASPGIIAKAPSVSTEFAGLGFQNGLQLPGKVVTFQSLQAQTFIAPH